MRNIGNLEVSGSLNISGSAIIVGTVSASSFIGDGSGLVGVTSYTNTDTLNYINSIGVISGSQQIATEISGAFTSVSASIALDIANISTDFEDITNKPTLVSGSSQIIYNQISSIPNGIVSSSAQLANITIPGNLTITDRLTAQEFHTEFVSASIIYESGSTKFGDSSDDIHSFTGSLNVLGKISATTINNVVSSSAQISYPNISNIPSGIVSGSNQISALGFTTCVGDITGVTAGTCMTGGGSSGDVTISHADTSTLSGAQGSAGIASITVDGLGHVTAVTTATYSNCQGTVTSVGGTGTVNGISLSGTVTTTGNLTLGGTLSGITVSQLDGAAVQTSAEAFSDSDTVLMTAAAIEDRITGKGYTTCTGTVSSIATNNGLTGGTITSTGTIGLTGQALALHNLATNGLIARTGTGTVAGRTITGGTNITVTNGNGVSGNPTISTSATTCTGTVTSVTAGTYLTGGTITTSGTIAVDATNVNTASKIVARDASGNFCAGTITATSFVGDGSGLTGISGVTINNNTDNYLLTATGTTGTVNGEANLTFNGSTLSLTGNLVSTGTGTSFRNRIGIGDGNGTPFTNAGSPGIWLSYNGASDQFIGACSSTIFGVYIGAWRMCVSNTGTVTATCFVETSAQKFKTDIETFSCTDYFNCLRPVSFKWKETGNEDIGFIAEEVNKYYPTLVAKNLEDEPTGVKYTKIVPLLVKKIQEQSEQINQLSIELKDIYNKINKDI